MGVRNDVNLGPPLGSSLLANLVPQSLPRLCIVQESGIPPGPGLFPRFFTSDLTSEDKGVRISRLQQTDYPLCSQHLVIPPEEVEEARRMDDRHLAIQQFQRIVRQRVGLGAVKNIASDEH